MFERSDSEHNSAAYFVPPVILIIVIVVNEIMKHFGIVTFSDLLRFIK